MGTRERFFEKVIVDEKIEDTFSPLDRGPVNSIPLPTGMSTGSAPEIGRLHGFDLDDRPLVTGIAEAPGDIVVARATVGLSHRLVGSEVVLLFERGDPCRPIIVGVLQEGRTADGKAETSGQDISILADNDCFVVNAEREIVLRCGDASITLTRAGKIIIKGNYIISRSSGYNRIKGAAIDIN